MNSTNIHNDVNLALMNICDLKNVSKLELINHFTNYCSKGQIDIVKWLHEQCISFVNFDYVKAFKVSCENGHLDIAKWVHQFIPKTREIGLYRIFVKASNKNYCDVVEYLYSLYGKKIYGDMQRTFERICDCNIRMIKFIYNCAIENGIGIDFRNRDYYILKRVTYNYEALEWILSFYKLKLPEIDAIIYYGYILDDTIFLLFDNYYYYCQSGKQAEFYETYKRVKKEKLNIVGNILLPELWNIIYEY